MESPDLDDLRFDGVLAELKRRIPLYAPQWTDRNDSDPGMALLQLFAYLTEQIGYRLNRVPEKNHIELLRLLGVRLRPSRAAHSRIALLLTDPRTLRAYALPGGTSARARAGKPPPTFETIETIDVTPCEIACLVSTKNPRLDDLLARAAPGGRETEPAATAPETSTWLSVVWDGKKPKRKDLPLEPVAIARSPGPSVRPHRYLHFGCAFNPSPGAGFRGVRVQLTVQLDDDEVPRHDAVAACGNGPTVGEDADPIQWLSYTDASGTTRQVSGSIVDTTARFTRSGTISFTVPIDIGSISRWNPLRGTPTTTPFDACGALGDALRSKIDSSTTPLTNATVRSAVDAGVAAAAAAAALAQQVELPHPLPPTLRAADGWLRVDLGSDAAGRSIRMVTFNAVRVAHANTVRDLVVGRSTGQAGQRLKLLHGNVLPGSLDLAVRESGDPSASLVAWTPVDSLDDATPTSSVVAIDWEAGTLEFGDGHLGRIPPVAADAGEVIARVYRHGGGSAGNLPLCSIETIDGAPGLDGAVNFVVAEGGTDAETLAEAKLRARKEIATRSRAVTADDFAWIASNTSGIQVARAVVVPRRRPFPGSDVTPVAAPFGFPTSVAPGGLTSGVAAGVVSVIVVPQAAGPEPTPTRSFLEAVCRELDRHRLITTEVYAIAPQYCRVGDVRVRVEPHPGHSRAELQRTIGEALSRYLHVLGEDGSDGFPFGSRLYAADIMSHILRVEGVRHLIAFEARYWRTQLHSTPQQGWLRICPETDAVVKLDAGETVSFDVDSLLVSTGVA